MIEFDFDSNRPIYIQLVEQLELYIISGKIPPGERLPSVRDLAVLAKVNPNTMQRALTELEEMKLITTERTNGKFVTENSKLIAKHREKYANQTIKNFFQNMQDLGFDYETTINYINQGGKL